MNQSRPVREWLRADGLSALIAALACVAILSAGFAMAWPLSVDIGGTRDARFVLHFNEPERSQITSYRWTNGDSTLALPRPPSNAPALLALRMQNIRPDGQPVPQVALNAEGRELASLTLPDRQSHVYYVLVPPTQRLDWAMRVRITSDNIFLAADPRPLGVVVDHAYLAPLGRLFLPNAWLVLWAAALGLFGYTLLRLAGIGTRIALAGSIIPAIPLAVLAVLYPPDVLPFVQRVPALIGIACLGLVIARWLAPPLDDPRRVLLRGEYLPIYMAIAWWMLPLFQFFMVWDAAPNVIPAPQTIWIGTGLLVALGGLASWYALSGRHQIGHETLSNRAMLMLALAAGAHLIYMLWFAFQRQAPDFWILYKGAREWAQGGSLYNLEAVITNHFGHVFKVPPFYGMLFVPFVTTDGFTVLLFHRILNTLILGLTALSWIRMFGVRPVSVAGAGVLIGLNFRPLADTIAFGQIDLMLLLVLTLALWALRRSGALEEGIGGPVDLRAAWRYDALAGGLVALGTLFKIYPLLLLAFFVVKRRWGALAGFALAMLLLNGIAVAVMGWEMHQIYLTGVAPKIGGTTSWVENQTISGFLARFADSPASAEIFKDRAVSLLGLAIGGMVGLLACVVSLRPVSRRSTAFALQYGQFLLLMVLVVPAAWMHYETLLVVPFGAILMHYYGRNIGLPRAVMLSIAFGLVAYGNQWSFYDGTVMGVLTIAGISYKFYGMLLLGGVLVAELLSESAPLAFWRYQAHTPANASRSAYK